jgi:hypothetical protein
MLTVRILEGFSQLVLVSAAPTAMLKVTPKRYQAPVMTVWGTFFGVAFLVMNLLQGTLIQLGGWKAIFYCHAIFAAVVALVLTVFLKMTEKTDEKVQTAQDNNKLSFISQHKAVYKEIGSLLPGLLFVCHTLMYLVFLTYLPQKFNQSFPDELLKSNFLLISMPLFSLAGTFLIGLILNKFQKSPLFFIQYGFDKSNTLFIATFIKNINSAIFFHYFLFLFTGSLSNSCLSNFNNLMPQYSLSCSKSTLLNSSIHSSQINIFFCVPSRLLVSFGVLPQKAQIISEGFTSGLLVFFFVVVTAFFFAIVLGLETAAFLGFAFGVSFFFAIFNIIPNSPFTSQCLKTAEIRFTSS